MAAIDDPFGFPQKIQLQTLDRCNYRCPMCPYPTVAADRAHERMDDELLTHVIDDVGAVGRQVRLCLMLQNEPLLDRRFRDLLAQAHAAEHAIMSIATVTNGSTLTPELLDDLVAYERFHLTVSVNANDRDRYHQVHGVDLWPRIHELLTTWRGRRERVRLSFVVDGQSVDDAIQFLDRWSASGYATRLVPILSRAGSLTIGRNRRLAVDDFDYCHYPVDTLNVLADGAVILCCNDWAHEQTYGNLYHQSIGEIWNGPALSRARELAMTGRVRQASASCQGCDYPMRSSVRMQLEARCGATTATSGGGGFEIVEHGTELRVADRPDPLPVVVYDIDTAAGVISCAAAGAFGCSGIDTGSTVELCIRIAHGERFSFGSLTPTWCRATVAAVEMSAAEADAPDPGLCLLRLEVDRASPVARLLPWYADDWRRPAIRS